MNISVDVDMNVYQIQVIYGLSNVHEARLWEGVIMAPDAQKAESMAWTELKRLLPKAQIRYAGPKPKVYAEDFESEAATA